MSNEEGNDSASDFDEELYYHVEYILEHCGAGAKSFSKSIKTHPRVITEQFQNRLLELGWRPEYIRTQFQNMTDRLLNTWSYDVLIDKLFQKVIEHQGYLGSIKKSFIGIGLKEDVAEHLSDIVSPLINSSYTYEQVLHTGIKYLLGYYDPIASDTATHLIYPEFINGWKKKQFEDKTVQIYNIPVPCYTRKSLILIESALKNLPKNNVDKQYYFHATSWGSSIDIFRSIERFAGRTCLDFGITPGFYLAHNIMDSIEWCSKNHKRWHNETCIIIFSLPKILPKYIKYKELIGEEWVQVTKESRQCKKMNELQMIRKYDLFYGDMVLNINGVKYSNETPIPHTPPKKQLVGHSPNADMFLHKCLVGCIYFQKT
jgi:hypothetical protein